MPKVIAILVALAGSGSLLVFTAAALVVFVVNDQVQWTLGALLAVGQGAWASRHRSRGPFSLAVAGALRIGAAGDEREIACPRTGSKHSATGSSRSS